MRSRTALTATWEILDPEVSADDNIITCIYKYSTSQKFEITYCLFRFFPTF